MVSEHIPTRNIIIIIGICRPRVVLTMTFITLPVSNRTSNLLIISLGSKKPLKNNWEIARNNNIIIAKMIAFTKCFLLSWNLYLNLITWNKNTGNEAAAIVIMINIRVIQTTRFGFLLNKRFSLSKVIDFILSCWLTVKVSLLTSIVLNSLLLFITSTTWSFSGWRKFAVRKK